MSINMNNIKIELNGTVLRLVYAGDSLLFNTTSYILKYLEKLIHTTPAETIILDLSSVDHIDSSAVGMFISVKHATKKMNKSFRLTGLTDNVHRVLRILDIKQYLSAA